MKKNIKLLSLLIIVCVTTIGLCSITSNATNSDSNAIYTITYHLDGGTNALKNPDVYTSEDVITLKDATKVGYDFAGWFLDSEKTEQISEISNRTGNLDLYAKFIPKSYTATFDDNGATQSTTLTLKLDDLSISVNKGDVIDPYSISTPVKSGYVFLGWYDGEELITDTLQIDSDLTLHSKWKYCAEKMSSYYTLVLGDNTASVFVSYDAPYGGYYYWEAKDFEGKKTSGSSSNGYLMYTYVYVSGK